MGLFYRPRDGFVGDVIPFYWDGAYHAFYLKAPLPPARNLADGVPYAHLVSRDLCRWEEWQLAIEPGPPGSPDAQGCFTGCVIERNGVFHMFYTGYTGPDQPQTICRATSTDLRDWEKDPHNPMLPADPRWYEANDWRDPFVFWNEEADEYWMLLAAREKTGPSNRRGCIALATSPDLQNWKVRPPFWSPHLYFTHECPDLFRWGDKWVLVYSTFSERMVTHYRMSDTLNGPWLAPSNDSFDGRAYYAAKTAGDGRRRFVFGWNPTRVGEADSGAWQWGGAMEVHELTLTQDGGLGVRPPAELLSLFSATAEPLSLHAHFGQWGVADGTFSTAPTDGFAGARVAAMPNACAIGLTISCSPQTRSCGVLLRADSALECYYQIRWEPSPGRIVFDRWPRPGDQPFMLERFVELAPGEPLELIIVVEGSIVVVYANNEIALSCRTYDHTGGDLGLFVNEGSAVFTGLHLRGALA